jgi:putative membrane protein
MKKLNIWLVMLLCSVLTFQACSNDDDDEVMTLRSQEFVTEASSGNMLEIQAGVLATQKGQNQKVKDYGQHMVTDHTTASTQLNDMARSKNLVVPTELTAKHKQQLNVLTPLTGTAFDKAFTNLMLSSHQEQVALFERASTSVDDADLKNLAAQKLPVLRAHLTEAQQLNTTVNP